MAPEGDQGGGAEVVRASAGAGRFQQGAQKDHNNLGILLVYYTILYGIP